MPHLREEGCNDELHSESGHHPGIEDGGSEEEGCVTDNEKNKCRCVDSKDGVPIASGEWYYHTGLTITARVVMHEVHFSHL